MNARITLIDSGVNASHPHIRDSGTLIPRDQQDALGHGTAAAAAIFDLAPGSELHSIKIFKDLPRCAFTDVLAALEQAIDLQPDLINLSLGTPHRRWIKELERIVLRAKEGGIKLVAPASFRGLPSYPGCLESVSGVLMDANLPRARPEFRESGAHRYWYASPFPRDLPNLPRAANLAGVSMAAANLTGYLARAHQTQTEDQH